MYCIRHILYDIISKVDFLMTGEIQFIMQKLRINEKDHRIYILLTDYPDNVSKFLKRIGFWHYSHVSISTSMMDKKFFSFVGKKGFRIEDPVLHPTYKGCDVPCALFSIPVSESECTKITNKLKYHIGKSDSYKYSYLGLSMMFFGMSVKLKNQYTCSGFVSDVLKNASNPKSKEFSALVKPDDFEVLYKRNLVFRGPLRKMLSYLKMSSV